jgi:hypothetical protein
MVFVVLYAIFIFVFLKSLAVVLVSLPIYVNVAHFVFCVVFVVVFLFSSVVYMCMLWVIVIYQYCFNMMQFTMLIVSRNGVCIHSIRQEPDF